MSVGAEDKRRTTEAINHLTAIDDAWADYFEDGQPPSQRDLDPSVVCEHESQMISAIEKIAGGDSAQFAHAQKILATVAAPVDRARQLVGIVRSIRTNLDNWSSCPAEETGHFESYAKFAKSLRHWLIAYGVGGPLFLVAERSITDRVIASGKASTIALLFLGGVLAQVLGAMLWKMVMWYAYRGEYRREVRDGSLYRASAEVAEWMWLEFLIDASTIALFSGATLTVLSAL